MAVSSDLWADPGDKSVLLPRWAEPVGVARPWESSLLRLPLRFPALWACPVLSTAPCNWEVIMVARTSVASKSACAESSKPNLGARSTGLHSESSTQKDLKCCSAQGSSFWTLPTISTIISYLLESLWQHIAQWQQTNLMKNSNHYKVKWTYLPAFSKNICISASAPSQNAMKACRKVGDFIQLTKVCTVHNKLLNWSQELNEIWYQHFQYIGQKIVNIWLF